jgi:hypothetical protein
VSVVYTCPHCGNAITPAFAAPRFAPTHQPAAAVPREDSVGRQILKVLLAIWAIGYPVLRCSPLLATGTGSAGAAGAGGFTALILSSVLFFPWIIGIIVLGILVAVVK